MARTRRKKSTPPVVLIVEEEPDLRVLAESNIADFGYTTLSAGNGNEAMALLEEDKRIVLLFTDINMPDGLDGLELARRAIELRPGLRIVYASGAAPTDGMIALFVEGATFLQKPYTSAELMQAVHGDGEAADKHSG